MIATLSDVLPKARRERYALPGLVVLGWEDALAFARAGTAEGQAVILQAGPGCRRHTPLPILGAMFGHLARTTDVPVVAHLDHSTDIDECEAAIDAGFSSIMFDGSRLPLEENIARTRAVVEMARARGVSVEGEVGFVGYDDGEASARTSPDEARAFAEGTGVDALAVSVGNVHLQTSAKAQIDLDALAAVEAATDVPLVLHGASGMPQEMREHLAHETAVCKFNVGTELRQVFGQALRKELSAHPQRFDRIEILSEVVEPMTEAARRLIFSLGPRR